MTTQKNFYGHGDFHHFVGVVEDRQDPQKLGRVRVRVVGLHTHNKEDLPTADLPWSMVALSPTDAGISGLGSSPSFLPEGTHVIGFFRDGAECQDPLVTGVLPGYAVEQSKNTQGFFDPNGIYPKYTQEPDTNRLAVNNTDNPHLSIALRRATRVRGVVTADFDLTTAADGSIMEASDADTWDHPEIPYAAVYPFNKVYESESGHIIEIDDTQENERLYTTHRTGTSQEIDKDGNQVNIIKGDHYNIVSGKRQAEIKGNADITIGGRHKIYINKDGALNNHYDIHVGANANINVMVETGNINLVTTQGKVNVNAGGDYNVKVGGNYTLSVAGNKSETIEGSKTSNTTGAVIHRGSTIDLNP